MGEGGKVHTCKEYNSYTMNLRALTGFGGDDDDDEEASSRRSTSRFSFCVPSLGIRR